ncbi:MAG: LysR family transcriptional regulator [Casimicrobiaceae bacterium]
MDKLRALGFFCRTVEAKTFAAAAQTLDMVPSALSKAIAALEQDVGFRLLNRSTRRLALTDQGTAYYEHCRQLLQDLEEAEENGREGHTRPKGTLRVGMHPGFRFPVLIEMGRFLNEYPDLKVETVITNSPAAVLEDGLDLVIHIGRLADSSLVSRRLGWARSVTCASPAYMVAWGEPRDPSDLSQHRAVIYGRHDEDRNTQWEFVKGTERQVVDVPVRLVSRDGIGLIEATMGGCGIARPFDIAIRHHLATGQLQEVLREWTSDRHAVCAVTPPNSRRDTAKVRAYLKFFGGILADGES